MVEKSSQVTTRIVVKKAGSLQSIPVEVEEVTVISGIAWITADLEDIVLKSGQTRLLPKSKNPLLISGLLGTELVLKVRVEEPSEPPVRGLKAARLLPDADAG